MDTATPRKSAPSSPANLYDYALAQAKAAAGRRELTRDVEEMSAQGIDLSWMNKFAAGRIPGASYAKVHVVATFYMKRERAQARGGEAAA